MKKNSPDDIRSIARLGQNENFWDEFTSKWKTLHGVKALMEAFAQEQQYFQADFRIEVEERHQSISVTYVPEGHLYHFLKDVTDETKLFLVRYRQLTLENLIKRAYGRDVEVRIATEAPTSPLMSRFEIYS